MDAVPDPTAIVDAEGQIVFASARCKAVFGYAPEELVGQPVEMLMPERSRIPHRTHRRRYLQHLQPRLMGSGLELVGLRKDGGEFPIEVSLSPVETDRGVLVVCAVRDITDRHRDARALVETKQGERVLRDNEQRLRWALLAAYGGAWDWDLGGGPAWWSAEMYELWGAEPGTPMSLDGAMRVIVPEDRARVQRALEEAIAEHADYGCEFRIRHPSRGERWMQSYGQLSYDEAGNAVRMLGITLDVTDRKLAERALRRSNEELERLVSERTRELDTARQQAESNNQSKSRFLAAASHDLRQPLQSVGLYLSVLARHLTEPKQQEVAGKMQVSLEVMKELLDALLDISKLESGSVAPQRTDFSVQQLLERIEASHAQQAERKGLTLDAETTPCIVHSDPALLERVLDNFVANAIRYTERGGVKVFCEPRDGCAHICVSDTGVGIPEEKFADIFEEYYQIDNPVRDASKGLGLGLAIVKHIARLLGHRLDVRSTPGEGSTFSVEVPLGESAGARPRKAAPSTELSDRPPVVLLVEDDVSIIDATTLLLEAAGMRVHSALNGEEALARVAAGAAPDLILTDYRLPGDNGAAVIRRVREVGGSALPAILVTGDTSSLGDDARALEHCRVLHKPVDTGELLTLIERLARPPAVNPH